MERKHEEQKTKNFTLEKTTNATSRIRKEKGSQNTEIEAEDTTPQTVRVFSLDSGNNCFYLQREAKRAPDSDLGTCYKLEQNDFLENSLQRKGPESLSTPILVVLKSEQSKISQVLRIILSLCRKLPYSFINLMRMGTDKSDGHNQKLGCYTHNTISFGNVIEQRTLEFSPFAFTAKMSVSKCANCVEAYVEALTGLTKEKSLPIFHFILITYIISYYGSTLFFIGNSIFHLILELLTKFWKTSLKIT